MTARGSFGARAFGAVARVAVRHPWRTVALFVALTAALAVAASRVVVDAGYESYFLTGDPALEAYHSYLEEFGSDEFAFIVYGADRLPGGVLGRAALDAVTALAAAIEREVPFVDEVTTLADVEAVEADGDAITIGPLIPRPPAGEAERAALAARVLADPLYAGNLISEDGRYGAVLVTMARSSISAADDALDPAARYPHAVEAALARLVTDPRFAELDLHVVGDPIVNTVYERIVGEDSTRLGGIALAVIAVVLVLSFRSAIGVGGPVVVVLVSLVWVVGGIALSGLELTLMFVVLPALLMAVGIADSVHVISDFEMELASGVAPRPAAVRVLERVGIACLATSVTTAAGFLAMSVSPIRAVREFALYSAAAVMVAFLVTVTLLPAVLVLARRRGVATPRPAKTAAEGAVRAAADPLTRALLALARFDLRHPRAIVVGSAVVLAGFVAGIPRMVVDSNWLNEFTDRVPIKADYRFVDRVLGGTGSLQVLLDGQPGAFTEPAVLTWMDDLERFIRGDEVVVVRTTSVNELLRQMDRAFHPERAVGALPDSARLASQYLLLYEMSGGDHLGDVLGFERDRATIDVRVRSVETSLLDALVERIRARVREVPPPGGVVASVTGISYLWVQLMQYIVTSQLAGFAIAFAVITVILSVLFRSLRVGAFAMVPNLLPVLVTLGFMGHAGIPLDYVKMFIASITMGIAVDDTIHLFSRVRHAFDRTGRYREALLEAVTEVGRPIVVTSVVLALGFLVFLDSVMASLGQFGTLTASTVLIALVADLLLAPALIVLFRPFGPERAAGRERPAAAAAPPGS